MANINSWVNLKDLAPKGAVTFRYRKMTGQRKKFYESGKYFELEQDAEDPAVEWPDANSGKWAVEFYDEAGKAIPLDGSTPEDPITLQPIQFTGGTAIEPRDPAGFQKISFDRMLQTVEALAKTAVGANSILETHIKKLDDDLGEVSEKLEKSQPGVIGQLMLKHSDDLGKILAGFKDIAIEGVAWLRKENGVGVADRQMLALLGKMSDRMDRLSEAQELLQKRLMPETPTTHTPSKRRRATKKG